MLAGSKERSALGGRQKETQNVQQESEGDLSETFIEFEALRLNIPAGSYLDRLMNNSIGSGM
jgi:hypothetical protein